MIPPDQFILLAEKSRAIIQIDQWVITKAIDHLIELRANGLIEIYRNLSINLSANCFADRELIPFIKAKVAEYPFIVKHMTIEITETFFINDIILVKEKVSELKKMGFLIIS